MNEEYQKVTSPTAIGRQAYQRGKGSLHTVLHPAHKKQKYICKHYITLVFIRLFNNQSNKSFSFDTEIITQYSISSRNHF